MLGVHSGCEGDEILCNDGVATLHAGLDWDIVAGTRYMISVAGFGDGCGDFTLTVDRA